MQRFLLPAILSVFAISDAFAEKPVSDSQPDSDGIDLFVTGSWGNRDTNHHSFFVNSKQLSPQTAWKPGEQSFPLQEDIQGKVWEIRELIRNRKQRTNMGLKLSDLKIRRLFVSPQQAESLGRPVEDFTNQWSVCLTYFPTIFHEAARRDTNVVFPPFEYFVMLLDGSHGFEKIRPLTSKERAALVPKPNKQQDRILYLDSDSPYKKIHKTKFKIPRIQWDTRGFPLDLSLEASRAKDYLVKEKSIPEQSLRLDEIRIEDPFPRDKVREQALDAYQSYPWVIFGFRQKPANGNTGWNEVYVLLDGTILGTLQY